MIVTHPFHPLCGQELVVEDLQNRNGGLRVYFRNEKGDLLTIPVPWTSLAVPDPFIEIAQGRADFRLTDLLELAERLSRLRSSLESEV